MGSIRDCVGKHWDIWLLCPLALLFVIPLALLSVGIVYFVMCVDNSRQKKIHEFNLAVEAWEKYGYSDLMNLTSDTFKTNYGKMEPSTTEIINVDHLRKKGDSPKIRGWNRYFYLVSPRFSDISFDPDLPPKDFELSTWTDHISTKFRLFVETSYHYSKEDCGSPQNDHCPTPKERCESDNGIYEYSPNPKIPNCQWHYFLSRHCTLIDPKTEKRAHMVSSTTGIGCFRHINLMHSTPLQYTQTAYTLTTEPHFPSLSLPIEIRSPSDPYIVLSRLLSTKNSNSFSFGPSLKEKRVIATSCTASGAAVLCVFLAICCFLPVRKAVRAVRQDVKDCFDIADVSGGNERADDVAGERLVRLKMDRLERERQRERQQQMRKSYGTVEALAVKNFKSDSFVVQPLFEDRDKEESVPLVPLQKSEE